MNIPPIIAIWLKELMLEEELDFVSVKVATGQWELVTPELKRHMLRYLCGIECLKGFWTGIITYDTLSKMVDQSQYGRNVMH